MRAMAMKMKETLKQLMEMLLKSQKDIKTILKNSHEDMKTILKNSREISRNNLKAMRNSQETMKSEETTKNSQETTKTELKIEVKVDQSQLKFTKDEVKDVKIIKNEAEDKHEELKTEMRNMKENFVQFSTSGVVSVDGSGTSFVFKNPTTFSEITYSGNNEEEVTILGKQKIDCRRRIQDQKEELGELARLVQPLEQAKFRLEMMLESMRKEAKIKIQMRSEELEDEQCNTQKKIKGLEAQLKLSAAAEPERDDRVSK